MNRRPQLITLEGYADDGNIAVNNPDQSFYRQNFATLSGWKIMGFDIDYLWKPSKAKKTYGTIAAGAGALAAALPVTAPIAGTIAAGAGVAAGAMAVTHQTYKGGPGAPNPGTGYQQPRPVSEAPAPKKKNVAVPLIIAGVGVLAALGIASG